MEDPYIVIKPSRCGFSKINPHKTINANNVIAKIKNAFSVPTFAPVLA